MKWKELGARLGKFKYPLLVLLAGLILLAIPRRSALQTPEEAEKETETPTAAQGSGDLRLTEARLEEILSEIEGAGRVRVMLSYAAGEKSIYQTDSEQQIRTGENEKETRTAVETVLSSQASSRDEPVVVQTICPTYQGALIVCQGAGDAGVKLDLVNAVSSLTGLGADKITVIKMKSE